MSPIPNYFSNPIIAGFAPDPSICVVPSRSSSSTETKTSYFLTTSTFNLFPSCAIHHSTDLLNWELIGHALTRRSQIEMRTPEAGGGSWASTLRYRVEDDGKGGRIGRWYLCRGVFSRYRPQMDEREGRWWAVLLGVRPVRDGDGKWLEPQLGRETFLVGVEWIDDWPVFNGGKNVGISTEGPRGIVKMKMEKVWKADWGERLELGWYEKNTPLKKGWSLTERPGWLTIHGGCYDLKSPEAPTMLLRRQTAFEQVFSVVLDFKPKKAGGEKAVIFKIPTDVSDEFEEHLHTLEHDGPVALEIKATKMAYFVSIKNSRSGNMATEVIVESKFMTKTPPVGQPFLGVMFGLYAFANWEP
ncbi:hypothetical protein BKA65DRAFT_537416 [Rhexocercosporidium sp. MPI-PUGE-AT-0058]|nr:hypothetical protein BKA65DRAFT_537416 [Rhexocercosporidium sp. MPI-PUGE-AT-0058]